jgi:hypothetical protein
VLGGGVFDSSYAGFSQRVHQRILDVAPGARFRRLDAAPVLGAALLGLDAIGAAPGAGQRLRSAAPPVDGPGPE